MGHHNSPPRPDAPSRPAPPLISFSAPPTPLPRPPYPMTRCCAPPPPTPPPLDRRDRPSTLLRKRDPGHPPPPPPPAPTRPRPWLLPPLSLPVPIPYPPPSPQLSQVAPSSSPPPLGVHGAERYSPLHQFRRFFFIIWHFGLEGCLRSLEGVVNFLFSSQPQPCGCGHQLIRRAFSLPHHLSQRPVFAHLSSAAIARSL